LAIFTGKVEQIKSKSSTRIKVLSLDWLYERVWPALDQLRSKPVE
jgi:hypothetical protein